MCLGKYLQTETGKGNWHTDCGKTAPEGSAENKMNFILKQKMSFLRSCTGHELNKLLEKVARINLEQNEMNGEMQMIHTNTEMLEETRKTLLMLVSSNQAYIVDSDQSQTQLRVHRS